MIEKHVKDPVLSPLKGFQCHIYLHGVRTLRPLIMGTVKIKSKTCESKNKPGPAQVGAISKAQK